MPQNVPKCPRIPLHMCMVSPSHSFVNLFNRCALLALNPYVELTKLFTPTKTNSTKFFLQDHSNHVSSPCFRPGRTPGLLGLSHHGQCPGIGGRSVVILQCNHSVGQVVYNAARALLGKRDPFESWYGRGKIFSDLYFLVFLHDIIA